MSYLESAKGIKITKSRAIAELANHGLNSRADEAQFLADMGDESHYLADAVLRWLGY